MKRLPTTYFLVGLIISLNVFSSSSMHLDDANTDINDQKSLQNGAQLFMNHCYSCHSISLIRYNRISKDLFLEDTVKAYEQAKTSLTNNKQLSAINLAVFSKAIDAPVSNTKQIKKLLNNLSDDEIKANLGKATDKMIAKNLIFNTDKVGSPIISAMSKSNAIKWFGVTPPDLSLVARSKGVNWIYTYLHSFYEDESRPFGVNNKVINNVSMPDVLWQLKENQSAENFDKNVRDITNFLDYVGEPAKLVRVTLGYKVLGFLFILFILTYLLKKEFWRDVKYGKWRIKK